MGKKYYCDYCDKSLPDNVEGRKKHNSGLVHKKLLQAHYNMFMDSKSKLCDELAKGPCKRFQQGMDCRFGNECRFSHLLPHEFERLQISAYNEELWKMKLPSQLLKKREPNLIEFVNKMESLCDKKGEIILSSRRIPSSLDISDCLPPGES